MATLTVLVVSLALLGVAGAVVDLVTFTFLSGYDHAKMENVRRRPEGGRAGGKAGVRAGRQDGQAGGGREGGSEREITCPLMCPPLPCFRPVVGIAKVIIHNCRGLEARREPPDLRRHQSAVHTHMPMQAQLRVAAMHACISPPSLARVCSYRVHTTPVRYERFQAVDYEDGKLLGTSDPYVVVEVNDQQTKRTATMWDTLDPDFEEKVLEFKIRDVLHSAVNVAVMDDEREFPHLPDELGIVDIPVLSLPLTKPSERAFAR